MKRITRIEPISILFFSEEFFPRNRLIPCNPRTGEWIFFKGVNQDKPTTFFVVPNFCTARSPLPCLICP